MVYGHIGVSIEYCLIDGVPIECQPVVKKRKMIRIGVKMKMIIRIDSEA